MTKVVTEPWETDHENWVAPVVVARGKDAQLVVLSDEAPHQHSGLKEFDHASGPGSLLVGGNRYYFSEPDVLRSLDVKGQSWAFVVPGPHGEARCAAHPRVSPNGRWAACPVGPVEGEEPSPRFDLLLFELAPRTR